MGKKLKIRRAVKRHPFKFKLTKKQKQLYLARYVFTKKVITHAAYAAGAALILLSLIAPPAHSQTSEQVFPMTGISSSTVCATGLNALLSYSGSSVTTGNSAINCSNIVTDAGGDIGTTGAINLLSGITATTSKAAVEVNNSPVLTFSGANKTYTWGDSVNDNTFTNPVSIATTPISGTGTLGYMTQGTSLTVSGNIQTTGALNVVSGGTTGGAYQQGLFIDGAEALAFNGSVMSLAYGASSVLINSPVYLGNKQLFPFGGMYQICDFNNCGEPNPITGGYNCPPGYNAHQIGRIKWPDGTEQGSNMYACF